MKLYNTILVCIVLCCIFERLELVGFHLDRQHDICNRHGACERMIKLCANDEHGVDYQ